jgi:hypothetical protein
VELCTLTTDIQVKNSMNRFRAPRFTLSSPFMPVINRCNPRSALVAISRENNLTRGSGVQAGNFLESFLKAKGLRSERFRGLRGVLSNGDF